MDKRVEVIKRLRYHGKHIVIVSMLAILNNASLAMSDAFMPILFEGYTPGDRTAFATGAFFFFAYLVNHYGVQYGWRRMLPYQLTAVSLFLPLIFLEASIIFSNGEFSPEDHAHFLRICEAFEDIADCGPAFSHLIVRNTIRALPLMFILPAAFYLVLRVNFLNILDDARVVKSLNEGAGS